MEDENLVTKVDAFSKRFDELFDEFKEIVKDERVKMKAEVDAYNLEKERMKAVTVSDSDIIHLNVGGQKMTTKRSTLCQVEGSLLASMFSGRWEDRLERDKDGSVFFDFNPLYFALILDYLRGKKIETPENPAPLPDVPPEQLKNFNNLVGYLGLENELKPQQTTETFKLHSSEITIVEDGAVAVHGPKDQHGYVLGENTYEKGEIRWQLKLESFQDNTWMFVGIVKGDTVPSSNNSYSWSGSYGWALGSLAQVYTNGQTSNNDSLNACKQGDTVILTLNCTTTTLSLAIPSGQQFHLTLPSSATWKLHVNLCGSNDKIRIISP